MEFWISSTFFITFIQLGSFQININVKLSPPWITVVKYVNDSHTVKCIGNGSKTWKYNNSPLPERFRSSVSVFEKESEYALYLKFLKIGKEHKGIYNCSLKANGKKSWKGFELIVIQPVMMLSNPLKEVTVRDEEKEISLPCNVEGEPEPIINWFFNDKLEPHNLSDGPTLKKIVSPLDAGIYTCRAFQKILQTIDVEIKYEVKVRHKPFPIYAGHPIDFDSTVIYGFWKESRYLTCSVLAFPVAYFIWYWDNLPIDPKKNRVIISNLDNKSILEVLIDSEKVLGSYYCEAANPLGILVQTLELRLIERPPTPNKILLAEKSHSWAKISLYIEPYPSYNFSYKMDYTEYTYCSQEEKWKRALTVYCLNKRVPGTNKTQCKIENLKSFTKYAVRATISNYGGYGNYSSELFFRTRVESSNAIASVIIENYVLVFYITIAYIIK